MSNVNNVYYDWHGNEISADTIMQNQQSQQSQVKSVQHVQQGQSSSSSTHVPSTSNSATTHRSSSGGSTVRGVNDLGLENNPFSSIRMVVDDGATEKFAEAVDFSLTI